VQNPESLPIVLSSKLISFPKMVEGEFFSFGGFGVPTMFSESVPTRFPIVYPQTRRRANPESLAFVLSLKSISL
jgi:hypothetical protein